MIANVRTEMARFFRDQNGATAVEYGLMAGLISVGLLLVVNTVTADNLTAVFNKVSEGITGEPVEGGTDSEGTEGD